MHRGLYTLYAGQEQPRAVAIKSPPKAAVAGRARLLQEAYIVWQFHHRNIVQLIGLAFTGPSPTLVPEPRLPALTRRCWSTCSTARWTGFFGAPAPRTSSCLA